jgi:hypothetical protein
MRLIVIVFLSVVLLGIPAYIASSYIVHLRDNNQMLADRLSAVQAQLDAAIAEQQMCDMAVYQERDMALSEGGQCLFNCDARECYNRCQSCYKLIDDVNRAISIKRHR